MLLTEKSFETFPKQALFGTISESFAVNLWVSVTLINRELLAPL